MKKLISLSFLFALVLGLQAQGPEFPLKPSDAIAFAKSKKLPFANGDDLFYQETGTYNKQLMYRNVLRNGVVLNFNQEAAKRIHDRADQTLQLHLPLPNGDEIDLELVKVELFAPGFHAVTGSNGIGVDFDRGVHYQGIVSGVSGSIAAISVFENEVMGLFATPEDGNFVLGRVEGKSMDKADRHILYHDHDLIPKRQFSCATVNDLDDHEHGYVPPISASNKILDRIYIRVFIEIDDDVVTDKGSPAAANSYLAGMWNQIAILFSDQELYYQIAWTKAWDIASPYASITTGNSTKFLSVFKTQTTSLKGANMGHLVSYRISGGEAQSINNGLCVSVNKSLCVSEIQSSYQNIPLYSWSVATMAHEMGHTNGSRHTHACHWNGNNTAIDGCEEVEGSCARPPIPVNGGTIMSYCDVSGHFLNMSKGFGKQVGDTLYNRAVRATCLYRKGTVPHGQLITLTSLANNKLVRMRSVDQKLIASQTIASSKETFELVKVGEGYFALKSLYNNKYVYTPSANPSELLCQDTDVTESSSFLWITNSDNTVSLLSKTKNKWVTAALSGTSFLKASKQKIGTNEKFIVTVVTNAKPLNQDQDLNISLHPNPAGDVLNLEGLAGLTQVEVFDLRGMKLMQTETEGQLDISSLARGTYLIRVDGAKTLRFVKL